MPTLQDEQSQRQNLRTLLAEIDLLKPDDLRRSDLGERLNFDAALPFFERTWRLFRDLAPLDLERASYNLLVRLNQVAQPTRDHFRQVKMFRPEQFGAPQNAVAQRDALIVAIRDFYDSAYDQVMTAKMYLGHGATDVGQLDEDARRIVARMETLFAEQQNALSEKTAAADKALSELQTSAAMVAIAQFENHFGHEANGYRTAGRYWLWATAVLAMATIAFAGWTFRYALAQAATWTTMIAVQITVAKLMIFSVLLSGLVWCGHMYRANRHNFVLNKHRQTALNTFRSLTHSTDDPQVRSAILLQTTHAMFGHQPTGFASNESDISESTPRVLDLLKPSLGQ